MYYNLRELEHFAQERRAEWENLIRDDKKRRDALPSSESAERLPIAVRRFRQARDLLRSFRL